MDLNTAALLNANDPERLRVEQESCQTAEGREAWLHAVQEAEKLRANLRSVAASPEAVTKALQVANQKPRTVRRSFYLTGAAAAIMLSVGGLWFVAPEDTEHKIVAATFDHQQVRKIDLPPQVKQLALLAMENFEDSQTAMTSARDMEALLVSLPEASELPKTIPELAPLQEMDGGKVVSLNSKPALLTRWTETVASGENHGMVVQQLYAKEVNLPADMNPVLVHIDPPGKNSQPTCDVLLWTQDGIAYLLVANSSDGCARRALQTLKQKMGSGYPILSET